MELTPKQVEALKIAVELLEKDIICRIKDEKLKAYVYPWWLNELCGLKCLN
jgi:hypothetical protein